MRATPILLTGAHRSGTTFVGRMLSLPASIGYFKEPFNKEYGISGIDQWFLYISDAVPAERRYRALIDDLLQGRACYRKIPPRAADPLSQRLARLLFRSRGHLDYRLARLNPLVRRFLVKDPIACLSSEYLHRTFDMEVVVLIRHPAGFAASLKRLGWRFNVDVFRAQPELMHDYLAGVLPDLPAQKRTPIEEAALVWRCLYSVLERFLARNPAMIPVRHEDIARDPVGQIRTLYERLEVPFTARVQRAITRHTSSQGRADVPGTRAHVLKRNSAAIPAQWKKILTPSEVATIRDITAPVAGRWYADESWYVEE